MRIDKNQLRLMGTFLRRVLTDSPNWYYKKFMSIDMENWGFAQAQTAQTWLLSLFKFIVNFCSVCFFSWQAFQPLQELLAPKKLLSKLWLLMPMLICRPGQLIYFTNLFINVTKSLFFFIQFSHSCFVLIVCTSLYCFGIKYCASECA